MNLQQRTVHLLKKYQIKPLRRRGQNFLISEKVLDKIIEAAEIKETNTVLEVGSGLGALTGKLVKRAKQVVAVELDKKMTEILRAEFSGTKNLEIAQDSILDFDLARLQKKYQVVANLPYNITSAVIRKFLESANKPESLVLMVQKEVAERICATPPKMSLLAVAVQFFAIPKIVALVKKGSFLPMPEVDSAIIRLDVKSPKNIGEQQFFRMVKAGFSSKRKKLAGNLAKEFNLDKSKIEKILENMNLNKNIRAEGLSMDGWQKLLKNF